MMRYARIFCIAALSILLIDSLAHAGLKELMKVGKEQERIAKALKQETKNYNRAKEAILSGKLKEGMTASDVRKKCGEPILDSIFDRQRGAYKWLYMPETSTHFKGEKLYLYIDKEDKLVGWKLVEPPPEEEDEEGNEDITP